MSVMHHEETFELSDTPCDREVHIDGDQVRLDHLPRELHEPLKEVWAALSSYRTVGIDPLRGIAHMELLHAANECGNIAWTTTHAVAEITFKDALSVARQLVEAEKRDEAMKVAASA